MSSDGGGASAGEWVTEMKKKMTDIEAAKEIRRWSKGSIYRVPACIKELNVRAYKPQVVSFGPHHHGDPQLLAMEEHKQRALLHFLKRSRKQLEDFVAAVSEVARKLLDAYDHQPSSIREEEWWRRDMDGFLKMMILDGCFMLEIMRKATTTTTSVAGRRYFDDDSDYVFNDPIFSSHGVLYVVPYVRRDMLMLENQIPLLLLDKLLSVETAKPKNDDHINKLVLKFLSPTMRAPTMELGLHPLDVLRKSIIHRRHHHYQSSQNPRVPDDHHQMFSITIPAPGRHPDAISPPPPPTVFSGDDDGGNEIVRSATELNEAGIQFKRSKTNSLQDITFRHTVGVLRLPSIIVDDSTEFMFLNLMAFERLHVGAGNQVTAYVFFMDNIIDSPSDVGLLHAKGIIHNALGSDKAVADMFNSLSKDVVLDPDGGLVEVHKEVNDYCKKRWNMWRANLLHTYFRSPWAFLSLAAAIFLLVLTVLQTLYSILPYYKKS